MSPRTEDRPNYIEQSATTEPGSEAGTETGDSVKDYEMISKYWVGLVSDTDCEE